MKRLWRTSIIALMLLLSGCAGPMVRSNVTAFHEWPGDIREKIFVFERSREQDNDLEYRRYENLVRGELQRLGFAEASTTQVAKLKVTLAYGVRGRDIRVVEGVATEPYWLGPPLYGHRWRGRSYYGPYYDPFWPAPPITTFIEKTYQLFSRQLKVTIAQNPSGKKLYDVIVDSEGPNSSLAAIMPYLVRSAFAEFPGASGVPRRIELKLGN